MCPHGFHDDSECAKLFGAATTSVETLVGRLGMVLRANPVRAPSAPRSLRGTRTDGPPDQSLRRPTAPSRCVCVPMTGLLRRHVSSQVASLLDLSFRCELQCRRSRPVEGRQEVHACTRSPIRDLPAPLPRCPAAPLPRCPAAPLPRCPASAPSLTFPQAEITFSGSLSLTIG